MEVAVMRSVRCFDLLKRLFLILLVVWLGVEVAEAKTARTFRWQIGSVTDLQAADRLREEATQKTSQPVFVDSLQGVYKVTVGEFFTYQEASEYGHRLSSAGLGDAVLVEVLSLVADQTFGLRVFTVQVGSFANAADAQRLQSQLQERGVREVNIHRADNLYIVRVGVYENREDAVQEEESLRRQGFKDAVVADNSTAESSLQRRVISISPAVAVSRTSSGQAGEERGIGEGRYQLMVGPFANPTIAREVVAALRREGFGPLHLESSTGNHLIEVGSPGDLMQANTLKQTLADKGFLRVSLREVVLSATADQPSFPATLAASGESPEEVAETAEGTEQAGQITKAQPGRVSIERELQVAQATAELRPDEAAGNKSGNHQETTQQESAVDLLLLGARKLVEQGEYRAARTQYNLVLEKEPDNREAFQALTQLPSVETPAPATLEQAGTQALSVGQFQQIAALLVEEGDEALAQGNPAKAQRLLEQAVQLDPGNPQAQAKYEEAAQLLDQRRKMQVRAARARPVFEQGDSFPALWLIGLAVGGVVVAGAAAIGFVFLVIRRKRLNHGGEPRVRKQAKAKAAGKKKTQAVSGKGTTPAPKPLVTEDDLFLPPSMARASAARSKMSGDSSDSTSLTESKVRGSGEKNKVAALASGSQEEPKERVVLEQSYDEYPLGASVETWEGGPSCATLRVARNPLIAGDAQYLMLVKEPSENEACYQTALPEAGRRPALELEVCCLGINNCSMGVYPECTGGEDQAISVVFEAGPTAGSVQVKVADRVFPYRFGDWQRFRWELNLDGGCYSLFVNEQVVITDVRLPATAEQLRRLSLKADPEAEGVLLVKYLKLSSGESKDPGVR